MSKKICLLAVLFVAAVVGLTPAAHAQCSAATPGCVHYIGVGSSAMFNGFAFAAYNDLIVGKTLTAAAPAGLCPVGDACSAHWFASSNAAGGTGGGSCIDSRPTVPAGAIVAQKGTTWIDWVSDDTAGPNAGVLAIWAYLNVDSTVGNRCFLAKPTPTYTLPAGCAGGCAPVGPDLTVLNGVFFSGGPAISPLSPAAFGALNTLPFTAGMTDIRPEDALFATQRINGDATAQAGCGGTNTDTFTSNPCFYSFALGYDLAPGGNGFGGGVGANITDTSGSAAQPVLFALPGFSDPLSGAAVPLSIRVFPVGESPIVFVTNRSNANGMGQIIGNFVPTPGGAVQGGALAATAGNCYGVGGTACEPDDNGQPVGYVSDASYYVRNVWDQHPWPMVNNQNPTLRGITGAPADPDGNGTCPNGEAECQVSRRPVSALFGGNDCMGDAFAFTWPLAPGHSEGMRAQIPNRQDFPVTVFLREPLSGTYNTTEWSVIRRNGTPGGNMGSSDISLPVPQAGDSPASTLNLYALENPYPAGTTFEREVFLSQEGSIDPTGVVAPPIAGDTMNPLSLHCPLDLALATIPGANTAGGVGFEGKRIRGIGTGHVVNGSGAVLGVFGQADSIAYAFFSFGNVSKIAKSKNYGYLMIDAIDPLFDNYENATPGSSLVAPVTLANSTHFPTPWGDGTGAFPGFGGNVEGEPACENTGFPSVGCPFALEPPASQEPGQPAGNAALDAALGLAVGPTTWGVLPVCGGAGQPACTATAIWHTPVFGVDESVNCPAGQPCTYPHLRDGSYPAWSELRMECDTTAANCTTASDALGAEALVQNLEIDVHSSKPFGIPDLLPFDDANASSPYGDVYFLRDHFQYAAMDDVDIHNATGPWPSCANITSHMSTPAVTFGPTADCPGANIPTNGPPQKECGGDAGGFVRAARPGNYAPFYSMTGAFAAGCATTGIIGDLN